MWIEPKAKVLHQFRTYTMLQIPRKVFSSPSLLGTRLRPSRITAKTTSIICIEGVEAGKGVMIPMASPTRFDNLP